MITISAFAWVPDFARGQVRDLRVRWALEEAGLSYKTRLLEQGVHSSIGMVVHSRAEPLGAVMTIAPLLRRILILAQKRDRHGVMPPNPSGLLKHPRYRLLPRDDHGGIAILEHVEAPLLPIMSNPEGIGKLLTNRQRFVSAEKEP